MSSPGSGSPSPKPDDTPYSDVIRKSLGREPLGPRALRPPKPKKPKKPKKPPKPKPPPKPKKAPKPKKHRPTVPAEKIAGWVVAGLLAIVGIGLVANAPSDGNTQASSGTITSQRPGLELGTPKFAISPPGLIAAMEGQQTLLDTRRVRFANALQNRLTEAWVEGADAVEGVHLVLVGSNHAAQADLATSLLDLLDPGSIEPREQEAIEAALQEAIETVQNGEGEPQRVDPTTTMSVEIYRADADRIEAQQPGGVLADIFADAVGPEDPVVLVIRPTALEALRLTRAEYLATLGRSMERVNGDPTDGNRYRASDDWSGRFVLQLERGATLTEVAIQLPEEATLGERGAQASDLANIVEPLLTRFLTAAEKAVFFDQFFDQSLQSFESFGVQLRLATHPDGSVWRVISAA